MIAPLYDAILSELDRTRGGPVEAEDPRTHALDVVIPRQAYLRVRRWALIDREIARTLTLDEAVELKELQAQLLACRRRVAPLPLEDLRRVHAELLKKAAAAEEGRLWSRSVTLRRHICYGTTPSCSPG